MGNLTKLGGTNIGIVEPEKDSRGLRRKRRGRERRKRNSSSAQMDTMLGPYFGLAFFIGGEGFSGIPLYLYMSHNIPFATYISKVTRGNMLKVYYEVLVMAQKKKVDTTAHHLSLEQRRMTAMNFLFYDHPKTDAHVPKPDQRFDDERDEIPPEAFFSFKNRKNPNRPLERFLFIKKSGITRIVFYEGR